MHRNIKLLALFNFLTDLDFLAPVAIIYFSKVAGSFALGMSVFSLVMVSSAIFEVPTGILSDKIGRKYTMICGAFAGLCAALAIAIGASYLHLVIGAICMGLARSFYSGNNDALLYDTLAETKTQDRYHEHLGKLASLFQAALAMSAVTGSIIANLSFSLVIWMTVLPRLVMVIISFFFIEPVHQKKETTNVFAHLGESVRQFRINRKLRLLIIASTIRFSLGEASYVFRSAFTAMLWPLWAVGIANMLSNLGAMTSYYFSGKLIDKYGPRKILTMEILFNRAVNLTAYIFPTMVSPAIMSTSSWSFGVSDVAMQSLLQKQFTDEQRATMGSLGALMGHIFFAAASLGIGFAADRIGPINTLITIQIFLLVPLLLYRMIWK